ncbi:hypothetical protein RFI_33168 [Reticulomyxa filosa]|uniref:Kelch motif family protein n=1 Tax=Reticulomyxa filosa TaxID=46433 RepID=X6LS62_RETFI|nr:hypothetical protein RFI_33168 [Reticulomyxa filosa]|eukprot:ETO04231.1 hypothetical protein RFI_33168 [Reticulomyxa filosa]
MSDQAFQALKELPNPLKQPQCVLHKYELIICGGWNKRACYSYHTIKNKYKFICEYPRRVKLWGHCVVKLVDNNNNNNKESNQLTLLSFGSDWKGKGKHTLVMKYVSVWSNISNKLNELNNCNQWVPFTDNNNQRIIIGRNEDDYQGVRAVIGGSNNNLLFITYLDNNISVFDLNTFQFIKHDTLPTNNFIQFHCFVSNSENRQGQEMTKANEEKNKLNYKMILFYRRKGLSIEYNEENSIFQFDKLTACDDIAPFYHYAYVRVNDFILFFGGWISGDVSKSVYKYSIQENKWMTFQDTLPTPLYNCAAILSEDDGHIHVIGGNNDKYITLSTHIKTKVRVWDYSQLSKNEIKCIIQYWIRTSEIKLGWIYDFEKIIFNYNGLKIETFQNNFINVNFFFTFVAILIKDKMYISSKKHD